jgi:DNA-binding protein HU-beta
MNKRELVARLAERAGLSQVKTMEIVNALFDAEDGIIAAEIDAGNKVSVPGFGTWNVKMRAPRTGTDPKSQKKINIPERRFPSFRPGKNLKQRVAKK